MSRAICAPGKLCAACVKEHLCSFGLLNNEPERLLDGARVLGLQVWGEDNTLYWRRGNKIPDMPRVVKRRNVFSLCGKLVGHLPVGGWLHVAVAFIKRRASDVTTGWDDKIDDTLLNTMIKEVLTRVRKEDPVQGRWCVDGQALSVWIDASSFATGMSLIYDGALSLAQIQIRGWSSFFFLEEQVQLLWLKVIHFIDLILGNLLLIHATGLEK